jgi:hypothetical protein
LTNWNANLAASAYGGQRTVSFYQTNRLNINLTTITNTSFSIVALTLLDPLVTANNDYFIGTPFIGDGVDKALHVGYRNSGSYTFAQYADDLNVTAPPAGPVIGSHIHPPGQQEIYLNGALAGSRGASYLVTVGQANVGRGNGGSFRGDIAELIVYSTNLTTAERISVENYLFNKWLGQLHSAATSVPFFVSSGPVVSGMRFTQQPTDTVAGVNIAPSVTVLVTNAAGTGLANLPVALSLISGSGTLNGTLTQNTDGSGVATFSDLNFTVTGQKQLRAMIAGAATNNSSLFNIVPAAPVALLVQTQPSTTASAGVAFATQPVVSIIDAFSNVVTSATDPIVASETANGSVSQTPGNAVQVSAVSGTATFSGLYFTNTGISTLTFASGALPTVNSGNINVGPGAAALISVQQQPSSTAEVGVVFVTQPIIVVTDAFGNNVANNTVVTATASAGTLQGQTSVGTAAGVATFAGLSLTNVGSITLTFQAGAASVNSAAVTVSAGPATTLVWTVQPGSANPGAPFGQQPVLRTADAGGNITTSGLQPTNLVAVHLISGSGLVGDTLIYNIGTSGSNGIITFNSLQINNAGPSNVLAADFIGNYIQPTNLANCFLWLDAYERSSLSLQDATNIVAWLDKSGTGNNAVNTTGYPITSHSTGIPLLAYGGQELVGFNGNNWLTNDLSPLSGSGYTIFIVDSVRGVTGNSYLMGTAFNGVDASLHIGYRDADTFTLAQYADDLNYDAPSAFTFNTSRLWSLRLTQDGTQSISLNGIQQASRIANAYLGTLLEGRIGQADGGFYIGDLAEVIVYNRSLDDTERAQVEAYLTHKWMANSRALTVPFPVGSAAAAPTLAIARNGANLDLTVTGTPANSYRVVASTNLTLPIASWMPIGTNIMDGTGIWHLSDTNAQPLRFYRAVTP